ncbi:Protein kinase-like domain protein [Niveomyces insectorum RCEF 264]|uniref:Protein kinase-like domain protein n=1 Tax=Niveomyces insectorum RCEF 264 TaxID=1081102 RepID=A0A162JET1_9HYPO|nr:Protein kinase-like domain protein [Niveomyces insectorum RCEF 264]
MPDFVQNPFKFKVDDNIDAGQQHAPHSSTDPQITSEEVLIREIYKDPFYYHVCRVLDPSLPFIQHAIAYDVTYLFGGGGALGVPPGPVSDDHCFCPFPIEEGLMVAPESIFKETVYVKRAGMSFYKTKDGRNEMTVAKDYLMQEARVLQQLSKRPHPNIVGYFGCRVRRGRVVGLVLERLTTSLGEYHNLDELKIDKDMFMTRLRLAVDHLHALGYAHNDINPNNIMIRNGQPVLIDFDAARPFGAELGKAGSPGWSPDNEEDSWKVSSKDNDYYALNLLQERLEKGVSIRCCSCSMPDSEAKKPEEQENGRPE